MYVCTYVRTYVCMYVRTYVCMYMQVLYAETPVNPTIMIVDLAELGELSRSLPDVVTIVDSTYGTPYLQQPLKYPGIDISLHSA